MTGWTKHSGQAVALDLESVDTDQLIPARFMSTPRSEGYGRFLLHDLRHDADGRTRPDFPLNRWPGATVLVTKRNFGSGSSREAAVYALADFGIRVVIAPSFGDIFSSNAVNNSILPARVSPQVGEALITALGDGPAQATVDLEGETLTVAGQSAPFTLDPVWREKLINGWDDIDLTRAHGADIAAFRTRYATTRPWAFPVSEATE